LAVPAGGIVSSRFIGAQPQAMTYRLTEIPCPFGWRSSRGQCPESSGHLNATGLQTFRASQLRHRLGPAISLA
jgi:hypothetical protein